MKERIDRKGDKRVYQPRIRLALVKDLYEMKEFTKRPMTVLLDEALGLYLLSFFSSPDYLAYQEALLKKEEEMDENFNEPNNDDYEDLSNWL
jgi:hypothetical protein